MNENDIAFMRRAIELAQSGVDNDQGGPFGCVVVKDGRIVGEGYNQVTSTNDPTAHAEIVAIRDACRRLKSFQLTDCTVYTSCEPCPMCLGAIYWARPAAIYFAQPEFVVVHRADVDGYVMNRVVSALFDWYALSRKTK